MNTRQKVERFLAGPNMSYSWDNPGDQDWIEEQLEVIINQPLVKGRYARMPYRIVNSSSSHNSTNCYRLTVAFNNGLQYEINKLPKDDNGYYVEVEYLYEFEPEAREGDNLADDYKADGIYANVPVLVKFPDSSDFGSMYGIVSQGCFIYKEAKDFRNVRNPWRFPAFYEKEVKANG